MLAQLKVYQVRMHAYVVSSCVLCDNSIIIMFINFRLEIGGGGKILSDYQSQK